MKKISEFLSENFQSLVVKFSIDLNRHVLVLRDTGSRLDEVRESHSIMSQII